MGRCPRETIRKKLYSAGERVAQGRTHSIQERERRTWSKTVVTATRRTTCRRSQSRWQRTDGSIDDRFCTANEGRGRELFCCRWNSKRGGSKNHTVAYPVGSLSLCNRRKQPRAIEDSSCPIRKRERERTNNAAQGGAAIRDNEQHRESHLQQ